jgi:hypothetical protein
MLAFLELGLSNIPVPLPRGLPPIPRGLPPIPRGLPPTPEANLRPDNPDELRCRGCTGVEKDPREDVDPLRARCAGDGVPTETERGESDFAAPIRGDGRLPEGDALYRGGVIVSLAVFAMGVISVSATEYWNVPVLSSPINWRCAGVRGMVVRGRDLGRIKGRIDVPIL